VCSRKLLFHRYVTPNSVDCRLANCRTNVECIPDGLGAIPGQVLPAAFVKTVHSIAQNNLRFGREGLSLDRTN
jgi:hypothetical protein